LQARVVDTAGNEMVASLTVALDREAPRLESAPANGAVIPPDGAAELEFNEPIDAASAATAITVVAPFAVDQVWTADGRRLLLSAAGAESQGEVTVTVGPGLLDRAGNAFNETQTRRYVMGTAQAESPVPLLLVALLIAGAALGGVAVLHSGRLREQRKQYAREVVGRQAQPPADLPAAPENAPAEDRR
ncbi:MAG: Ig-like domain-containing protein, partial [Anaerolineales bacterium]